MPNFTPHNFMLLPTMSCQGQCVYCFGPNKGPCMDEETGEAAVEFIYRIAPQKEKVHITFHGGEPTLAPLNWYRMHTANPQKQTRNGYAETGLMFLHIRILNQMIYMSMKMMIMKVSMMMWK